jgi:hypothetical protein
MLVTYAPAAADVQRWEFDPDRVRASEAELIEKRAGMSYDVWRADVLKGSIRARRVLLWHLIRRVHNALRYEDTPDFLTGELRVEFSVAELLGMRDRLGKAKLPDDEREQITTALDIEIGEAMTRDGITEADESAGKAPSPSVDGATG